jgi:hypothetical protein
MNFDECIVSFEVRVYTPEVGGYQIRNVQGIFDGKLLKNEFLLGFESA